MSLLNFNDYRYKRLEKETIIDKRVIMEQAEYVAALNEAFASKNIMRMIALADRQSQKAWYSSFVKDFYKVYNISIDKVKDEDFKEANVEDFFRGGKLYKDEVRSELKGKFPIDKRYLAICINRDKDNTLERAAKEDLETLNKYLKEVGFDLKKEVPELLKAASDNPAKFKTVLSQKLKEKNVDDIAFKKIHNVFTEYDNIRKIEIPVITSIIIGGHAVYHGFEPSTTEVREKREIALPVPTMWREDRYGVLHSPTLIHRYVPIDQVTNLKIFKSVSQPTIEAATDTVYYVDVDELSAKYDMGTKMSDRKIAKSGSPFFMSNEEIKAETKRLMLLKTKHKIDTHAMTALYLFCIKRFTMEMAKDSFKMDNVEFTIGSQKITSGIKILDHFNTLLKEYQKVNSAYSDFLKNITPADEDLITNKLTSKFSLDAKQQAISDQLSGYIEQILGFRQKALDMYSQMQQIGITFTKDEIKQLSPSLELGK